MKRFAPPKQFKNYLNIKTEIFFKGRSLFYEFSKNESCMLHLDNSHTIHTIQVMLFDHTMNSTNDMTALIHVRKILFILSNI